MTDNETPKDDDPVNDRAAQMAEQIGQLMARKSRAKSDVDKFAMDIAISDIYKELTELGATKAQHKLKDRYMDYYNKGLREG